MILFMCLFIYLLLNECRYKNKKISIDWQELKKKVNIGYLLLVCNEGSSYACYKYLHK
jgi:hypothetical protein